MLTLPMDFVPLLPLLRGARTIACPYCARSFPDDERRCPHCRSLLDEATRKQLIREQRRRQRSAIIIAALLIVVLTAIFALLVPNARG